MSEKLFDIIAIEGIDGTGKTTLRNRLKELDHQNKCADYISDYTEEPRKRPPYRKMLLEHGKNLDPTAQLILVVADRYEHIREYRDLHYNRDLVIDRLITDRYNDSSWVYQVVLGGVEPGVFHKLEEAFEIKQPDLVILLDLDPEIAMQRINARSEEKNHFDELELNKRKIMRNAYLERAATGKTRGTKYLIIDARMEMDYIVKHVSEFLDDQISDMFVMNIISNDIDYCVRVEAGETTCQL